MRSASLLGLVVVMSACVCDDGPNGHAAIAEDSLPPASAPWTDGVTLFDNGDYAGAVDRLKEAAAIEPGDGYRLYLLGIAQWKSGDLHAAEDSLIGSINLQPTRLKTWINLARVRNARDDGRGALAASDRALDLLPTSADALHQKGRALVKLGRAADAMDALKAAHDLDPDNGYIANTLGLLMIQTGKPVGAIELLETARVRLPHIAYVRNNLAVAYERAGRTAEAKQEYAAAVFAGDMDGKAMRSLVRLGATDTTDTSEITFVASALLPAEGK